MSDMRAQLGAEQGRTFALILLLLAAALVSVPVSAQATNIGNAANAVNSNHIADDAVNSPEIPANAVGSAQIAANSVGSSQLADNSVGAAQIANNSLNLFAGPFIGAPTGTNRDFFIGPNTGSTPSFIPAALLASSCTVQNPAPDVSEYNCGSDVHVPFNGINAFNADRVLEGNAITSNELSNSAIGYTDYFRYRFLLSSFPDLIERGILSVNIGDSHYADNGLNSSVFADNGIDNAMLSASALGALQNVGLSNNGINSAQLRANSVETAAIVDNAVTTAKLADDSVNSAKLADGAANTATIADNAVTTAKLADNAVTTAKIGDNAVTSAKLVDDSVTTAKIADNAVTTAKLVDDSVTTAKLADNSVTTAKIVDNAVTTGKIVDGAVTTAKIVDDAVTTAKLADNAVTTAKLVDNAVTTAKIVDNAVTTAKLVDSSVTTAKLVDSSVTTAKLVDASVTTAKIADSAVTTAKIADAAVTTIKIADNAVTSAKIADRTVVAGDIAFDSITHEELASSSVTGLEILDASVGEVDLDIRLVSDFDVVERTGQLSVSDAVATATGFADAGSVTSASGTVLAAISSEDQARIRQIVTSFQSSGVVASSHAAYSELSADVAMHIGGLLNGAALAQQEIGNRTDSTGSDWASSSLRGQTNWVRDRSRALEDEIDFSHQNIKRLEREVVALERGITMASAIGSTYVERGRRGSIDLSVSGFGDEPGISIGAGIRISQDSQFSIATSATQDFDDYIVRFGSNIQY